VLYKKESEKSPSAVVNVGSIPTSGDVPPAAPTTAGMVHISYACVELSGMSLDTFITEDKPDDADPLNQFRSMGWKVAFKSVILNQNHLIRLESLSAY